MKNKPGDLPELKKLPLSAGEFPKENWCFIEKEVADEIIESGESKEALFYERARVLLDEENLTEKVRIFLQSASEGYFPNFPFLNLPESIRKSMVAAIRDPKNSLHVGLKFSSSPLAVNGAVRYALEPQLEIQMEEIAYKAASEISNKIPESTPEDFMPPGTAPERAVDKAMNELMASDNPGIDRSRCSLMLDIDFTRSPTEIVREFEKIITREREKWKQPVSESRGKSTSPDLPFRELAILRLFDRCGNADKVSKFLENAGVDTLKIYKSPKGWNDARRRASESLEQLKHDLGGGGHAISKLE
ncbi:hypothetical protein VSU19_22520 [Verrucomicrobiales bacterium BCK34]|nr:hypothetical protein [Verrucomicrobiales bacterium BCK34]